LDTATGAKVKTYAVTGVDYATWLMPVTGIAYVVPNSTTLKVTFQQIYYTGTTLNNGYNDLVFDLATGTGTDHYRFDTPSGNFSTSTTVAALGFLIINQQRHKAPQKRCK